MERCTSGIGATYRTPRVKKTLEALETKDKRDFIFHGNLHYRRSRVPTVRALGCPSCWSSLAVGLIQAYSTGI